jgi:CBS domain-containing protein
MNEEQTAISILYHRKVKDLLETTVVKDSYVEKSEKIENVLVLFETKNHLWVVDDIVSLRVIGVLTESDTIPLLAPAYTPLQSFDKPPLQSFQYGLPLTVQEVMSTQPILAHTDDPIVDVIMKMKQHQITQLPVVNETDQLIGEITLRRLLKEYIKHQRELNKKE